ncbi:hypothetical protein NC651_024329 [Populus alba x Populus x berolinensis]|nr:hypothetical protein NC651_024329 [Populus alba x Populus x berolinensis]
MNPNKKRVLFTSTTRTSGDAKTVVITTTEKTGHVALTPSGGESTITSIFHKPVRDELFHSSIS